MNGGKACKYLCVRRKPSANKASLGRATARITGDRRYRGEKLYSLHEPTTEAVAKGKVHKRFEYGVKVSVVSTRKRGFVLGCKARHPRLKRLSQTNRLFVRARSKIEATISLLKRCYRLGTNYLKGVVGDQLNALCAGAAHNLAIVLRAT